MEKIVRIKFGSHLYGTDTPNSDLDIKGLYLPTSRDILLQCVQPVISLTIPKKVGKKNTSVDIDEEYYTPKKFLELLPEGHPAALEMLFAPKKFFMEEPDHLWSEIKNLGQKLLTKRSRVLIRYCRQQTNKYGIKGSRAASVRASLDLLTNAKAALNRNAKLSTLIDQLQDLANHHEFISIENSTPNQNERMGFFVICGKKASLNAPIKDVKTMLQCLIDEYGKRSLAAETNEGVDWKSLSHAVRVGRQSIEFLRTGFITFPRPEATHLLAIKQGKLSFREVCSEIEMLFPEIEAAAATSCLPSTYDQPLIDCFIERVYRDHVCKALK